MRTTLVPARAAEYRRAGGPWDVPPLDTVLARSTPAAVLVEGPQRINGRELERRVAQLAAGLRGAGVKRRDVVAWQLPNVVEAALLYRACWRLGAVAAPVHHQAGSQEAERMLGAVDPAMFLTDRNDVRRLTDAGGEKPVKALPSALRSSDIAVALFTSGSTGQPKAVLHTHRGLAYKARLMARVHGLHKGDVVLMPAPLAHISGLLNGVLVAGAAGMRSVLMPKWDPSEALDLIETERVSFMIGPPTFFVGLMGASDFDPKRVESLRLVSSGGAGVSPGFVAEASHLLGCRVKRTYGSTEAPTITTSTATDKEERARQTDGRPVGEAEVRLGDDDELQVRGPELFAGYADVEQTKRAVERGGWFRTGDKATIDRDGWVTIVGRIKDVVIRGGENISVAEVEAVLEAHPAVRQAVAVGVPDARLGERLVAFVVASKRFDLDACRAWFADQGVARYKTPERIVRLDRLPTLAAGKPDRSSLKEIAAAREGKRVMKRRIGVAGLVLTLMALTLTAVVSFASPASAASPTDEQGFVDKINQERTSRNLRPLIFDMQIRDVARAWSDTMASSGNFVHNPNYSKQIPAGWTRAAENIAWGSGSNATVAVLHQALMNSSGHRANILGDFTRVGVGVTVQDGKMWVTQNFGKYPNDPIPSGGGTPPSTTTTTTTAPATTTTTTAPASTITLTVAKGTYDDGTKSKAILTWSGASGSNVDVYRNGTKATTTANDGQWVDKAGVKLAAGTVRSYKVCRAGTTTCSPTRSVTF